MMISAVSMEVKYMNPMRYNFITDLPTSTYYFLSFADSSPSVDEIGAQMLQYENASRLVDAMYKLEGFCGTTPVTLAVEHYLKREGKMDKISCKDEAKDADGSEIIKPHRRELPMGKVNKTLGSEACMKKRKFLADSYGSFKGLRERHDTEEKSLGNKKQSYLRKLVSSVSFNDKIYHMTKLSPSCQKKKSAVIRLSYTRKSYDGEETTEFREYKQLTSTLFNFYFIYIYI